jgi:hypothetical protein
MSLEIKLGPPIWVLLHSIVEKVKNDNFNDYKLQLFNLIKKICIFFPSVVSSKNANAYFSNFNPNYINNLTDIRMFLFNYHNFINKKLEKPIFNYYELTKYDAVNIPVLQNTIVNLYTKNTYMKLLPNYFNMRETLNEVNNFLFNNIYSLIKISEPIKEYHNVIENVVEDVVEQQTALAEDASEDAVEQQTALVEDVLEEEESVLIEETNVLEKELITQEKQSDLEEKVNETNVKTNNSYIFQPNNIYKNISIIDDAFLPSVELTLSEAMLEIMKNPKCVPFKVYVSRWEDLKLKDNRKKKIKIQESPVVDDSLLPSLSLSFPIAMSQIRKNPKCVPFDLYIKRWNECKVLNKHKKKFN